MKKGQAQPKKTIGRSGLEKKVAKNLERLGIKFEYETLKLKYKIPEEEHTYTPDFILPNGIIIECKGRLDRHVRKKMLLVKEQHPDKDIRILFMRNNTLYKGSKTRYTEWAKKAGYICAVSEYGNIPEEWLLEKPPEKTKDDA